MTDTYTPQHRGPFTIKPRKGSHRHVAQNLHFLRTHNPHRFSVEAFQRFFRMPDNDKWLIECMRAVNDSENTFVVEKTCKHLENLTSLATELLQLDPHQNIACLLFEYPPSGDGGDKVGHFMFFGHLKGESHCVLYDSLGRNRDGDPPLTSTINDDKILPPRRHGAGIQESAIDRPMRKKQRQELEEVEQEAKYKQPLRGQVFQALDSSTCGMWAIQFFLNKFSKAIKAQHIRAVAYTGVEEDLKQVAKSNISAMQLIMNDFQLYKWAKRNLVFWAPKEAPHLLHEDHNNETTHGPEESSDAANTKEGMGRIQQMLADNKTLIQELVDARFYKGKETDEDYDF